MTSRKRHQPKNGLKLEYDDSFKSDISCNTITSYAFKKNLKNLKKKKRNEVIKK